MKKALKIGYILMLFGWFPIIFMNIWAINHHSSMIQVVLCILSVTICAFGGMYLTRVVGPQYDSSLDEERKKLEKAHVEFNKARSYLTSYVLKRENEDRKKHV